jgi:hypothetical protein
MFVRSSGRSCIFGIFSAFLIFFCGLRQSGYDWQPASALPQDLEALGVRVAFQNRVVKRNGSYIKLVAAPVVPSSGLAGSTSPTRGLSEISNRMQFRERSRRDGFARNISSVLL